MAERAEKAPADGAPCAAQRPPPSPCRAGRCATAAVALACLSFGALLVEDSGGHRAASALGGLVLREPFRESSGGHLAPAAPPAATPAEPPPAPPAAEPPPVEPPAGPPAEPPQGLLAEAPAAPPPGTPAEPAAAARPAEPPGGPLVAGPPAGRAGDAVGGSAGVPREPRVYVVTATGAGRMDLAFSIQQRMAEWMSPQDVISHVCEEGCLKTMGGGNLSNVFEVPNSPDGHYQLDTCKTETKEECHPLRVSQMKFVYGLVREVRRLKTSGGAMPRWWLVKDDDTYVNMANLIEAMESRGAGLLPEPPWRANVSFTSTGCAPQVCGGAGWVLSAELAERLCLGALGDAWIHEEMHKIVHPRIAAWYDQWLRYILRFMMTVPKEDYATVIRLEEMNEFAPMSDGCMRKRPDWTTCYDLGKVCRCSRTLKPATFHLKGDWRTQLDVLIKSGL